MTRAANVVAAILAVFVVVAGFYLGACLFTLKQLRDNARNGDGAAILARTDLPRLRQSLADQILSAYERKSGADKRSNVLRQVLRNFGPGIADQLVAQILTPERLSQLLARGTVQISSKAEPTQMPALSDLKIADAWTQVHFINPVSIGFRTSSSDDAYEAVMHFADFQWKLAGIKLPDSVLNKLASSLR